MLSENILMKIIFLRYITAVHIFRMFDDVFVLWGSENVSKTFVTPWTIDVVVIPSVPG